MLDLSVAFDTIDHDILLSQLCNGYGVTGNALGWFRSCLTGRIQRVVIMVPTGLGNREKSGNLTWVPPRPGKVRLFINTCSNPGKVRDFKVS